VRFQVIFTKEAIQDLDRLDRKFEKRIQDRLDELALEPYSFRLSKLLKTGAGERTSRVGDWRIIYEVLEKDQLVKVLAVRPRSKAYKYKKG
jgi:mRNA interferase RelE/StbE